MQKFIVIACVSLILISCSPNKPTDNCKEIATGMNLIEASGNEFIMGEQDSIIGHDDELPAHSIKFTYSWYMDKTEVTQKSYSELMSKTYATYTNPPWGPVDIPFIGRFNFPKGDDYPAYFVNWFDAALYCNARSKEEGLDTVYSYTSVSGIPGNEV